MSTNASAVSFPSLGHLRQQLRLRVLLLSEPVDLVLQSAYLPRERTDALEDGLQAETERAHHRVPGSDCAEVALLPTIAVQYREGGQLHSSTSPEAPSTMHTQESP